MKISKLQIHTHTCNIIIIIITTTTTTIYTDMLHFVLIALHKIDKRGKLLLLAMSNDFPIQCASDNFAVSS